MQGCVAVPLYRLRAEPSDGAGTAACGRRPLRPPLGSAGKRWE